MQCRRRNIPVVDFANVLRRIEVANALPDRQEEAVVLVRTGPGIGQVVQADLTDLRRLHCRNLAPFDPFDQKVRQIPTIVTRILLVYTNHFAHERLAGIRVLDRQELLGDFVAQVIVVFWIDLALRFATLQIDANRSGVVAGNIVGNAVFPVRTEQQEASRQ